MKLTIIGCSGSFPGPESPASCYLLTARYQGRTWRVVVDLGNGALGKLQQHLALEDIDAVCLSHLHPDHYMDLCGLHVAIRWRPGGWPGQHVPVYGPSTADQRIASAYGMDPNPGMHPDFDFKTWQPRQSETIGPFTITPVPVRHPIEEAYALRIDIAAEASADGKPHTLTYSGDTDACDGLIEAAQDADVFLCEAAFEDGRDDHIEGVHLNGHRAGVMARSAGVGRLLLTHIPVWTSQRVLLAKAREQYAGDLAVAVAGVTYEIGASTTNHHGESEQ
ncbi:MBL fold metallo-hydrolase [Nesterenkonia sandarakina]|uniref:Ribonuclease BN (tRNA processing enzyme) n=1 Tax=Nesterenkonia sandarakina TaxID=272918 RepID=A0A2T0YT50_9MICC|nr:MBL fold metallo-hydrolase [Nesterenkonia sandarakina]PRZ18937.1 ribonuclease BN (tRNA processing enzyme) [Nesterenkonia sandarakina]